MGKIRIQPLNEDGIPEKVIVSTISNFSNKEKDITPLLKHGGMVVIEAKDSDDLMRASQHLFHLADLDLKDMMPVDGVKKVERTKAHHWNEDWEDYRLKFIKDAMEASKGNQDKLIEYLRKNDFVFLDSITLLDRFPEMKKKISKIKLAKYQWMLKSIRMTTNPEKDLHDPLILFGITISPKRNRKTIVYLNKKFLYSIKMEIPKKLGGVKHKPVQLIKYPDHMEYLERNKWGREHRQLMKDPSLKPSRFYTIYNQDVIVKGNLIIYELNNKHEKS